MSENKKHKKHVHPLAAWVAIAAFSLTGGLMTAMTYAEAADPAPALQLAEGTVSPCRQACYDTYNSCSKAAGTDAAALGACRSAGSQCIGQCGGDGANSTAGGQNGQPNACRQACYATYNDCMKTAGDDQTAQAACKSAGMQCVSKCGGENGQGSGDQGKPQPTACAKACYATRMACTQKAGSDSVSLHLCNATALSCMTKCAMDEGTAPAIDSYHAAVETARQHFLDGQKKLLDEYQAALEKAWRASMSSGANPGMMQGGLRPMGGDHPGYGGKPQGGQGGQ